MSLYHTPPALEASLLGLKSHSLHNHPITESERERETERGGEERGAEVEVGGQDERQSSRAEVACISIYRLMSHILFWQSKVQKATKTTKKKVWVEF